MNLSHWIDEHAKDILATYQHLHTIPELGHKENKTAAFLAQELRKIGFSVEEKVDGTTGILATLTGKEPGVVFGLRADMDGLPITEETGLPYASQHPGVMHACGHDANSTMVLWTGRAIAQKGIRRGSLVLVFQPAEELLSGARSMLASGRMNHIDELVSIHLRARQEVLFGQASPGVQHCGAAVVTAVIHGESAHGARPHLGINAAETAGMVMQAVSNVRLDPRVVYSAKTTRCVCDPGASNIIPNRAELTFDVRCADNSVMDTLLEKVNAAVSRAAAITGATAELTVRGRIPAAQLDPQLVADASEAITTVFGQAAPIPLASGSEDFHCYAAEGGIRTTVVGLGSDVQPGNHNCKTRYNTDCIPNGVKILSLIAEKKLC